MAANELTRLSIAEAGEQAEVLLRCDDGAPALTRRDRFHYLAGLPNDPLRAALLRRLATEAGLALLDLPEHIRLRDNGPMRYVFNYGESDFDLSAILGEAPLLLGARRLAPCGEAPDLV